MGRWGVLVGASAVVAVAAVARADEEPKLLPYTVQKGDACDTVAQKVLGDARLFTLVHQYNPQLGPSPHHLKEGQVLMLPAPAPDARLQRVRNRVDVQSRPARANDPLYRGNRVSTGASSAADMKFRDETQLSLGEDTLVIILGATSTGVAKTTDATLVTGALRTHLAELAGRPTAPTSVETASGEVKLAAGDTQIGVDEKKATRLAVYNGRAALVALKTVVRVDEGFGSKAEQGKKPTPPRPLPAKPEWASPPARLALGSKDPVDVVGTYGPGAGGPESVEWHVQLAHDADFHDILVDTRVPQSTLRLEAKGLTPGSYFARVSGIDADHFEGPYGDAAKTTVASAVIKDAPNSYGELDELSPGLLCGFDGAPPSKETAGLRIDRLSAHTLRCTLEGAPEALATREIPAIDPGSLVLGAHWLEVDAVRGEGEAVLLLADDHELLSRASATVTADPGVVVIATEPGREDGRYFVRARWSGGTTQAVFHLALGSLKADAEPLAIPPAPAAAAAVDSYGDIGAAVGIGTAGGSAGQVGVRGELRAGLDFVAGPGEVVLGARAILEDYPAASVGTGVKADHADYGGGLVLGYRALSHATTFRPYVTVSPQVLGQSSNWSGAAAQAPSGSAVFLGVAPVAGISLRSGSGSFFAEAGYRFVWTLTQSGPAVPPNGAVVSIGYGFDL